MGNIKIFSSKDLQRIIDFQKKLQLFTNESSLVGNLKKSLLLLIGVNLNKTTGKGFLSVVFFSQRKILQQDNIMSINLSKTQNENHNRVKLLEILIRYKKIKVIFKNYHNYNKIEKIMLRKYIDQIHPEAVVLSTICAGRGIDVGCGFRKTHPNAIGIDWVGKGELGRAGNVKGIPSEADIKAKGDSLKFFKNNLLDYIVARHNLEHYHKPEKTLQEWLRVLKKGGLLGIIVPNSANPHTAEKTHFYNFTLENFREMLIKTKQIRIIKIGKCIPGWSFYCIAKKVS